MRLKLPPIGLAIPPAWDAASEQAWLEMKHSAGHLADTAVAGGAVRADAEFLRTALREGREDAVTESLRTTRMARSLTWLWVETDGDCRGTVSVNLLEALAQLPITRGAAHFLARLYFERFDELDELAAETDTSEKLDTLQTLLRTKINDELGTRSGSLSGVVGALHEHSGVLLDREAPRILARHAKSNDLPYTEVINDFSLDGFVDGRFGELVRQYLVLEELSAVLMSNAGPLLDEVKKPNLNEAPHRGGTLFGHAALTVMIDRAGDEIPPPLWRQAVLAIAGDPRRVHTDEYQKWWSKLGATRIETVTRWIAVDELQLFLRALERFADESGNESMARMYPPRQRLLEGLLREKRVVRSRLFLGSRARSALARAGTSLLDVPILAGGAYSERALIYLDCGDFHIVEGSHNTKLWAYLRTPPRRLVDPRVHNYDYQSLTQGLAYAFDLEHGDSGPSNRDAFAHSINWQHRFLGYLARQNIYVDPESVLNRSDYLNFRRTIEYSWVAALSASRGQ